MGLPGFSGFVAELSVLVGAWHAFPTAAVLVGVGILLGVVYTLRVLQLSFFAEPEAPPPTESPEAGGLASITLPERAGDW